jgi:hypothetical protein
MLTRPELGRRTPTDPAFDDGSHARLRKTLRVFLRAGMYTATAERLALHKTASNTASAKPKRRSPDASTNRRADLELALRACQYLGQAVLRPVDSGSSRAG